MPRPLLGVAGFPVAHSRSPAMHNAALAEMGLDWLYVALPLAPDRFAETVRALPESGFLGVNVTVPHKPAAHELADRRSPAVEVIGAANTLTFRDGQIDAENTDAGGFLDALAHPPAGLRALVLGAGGSARAVAWALIDAGAADVSVFNRDPARAVALAHRLGARQVGRPAADVDLVVNCTSVGLDPSTPFEDALDALGLAGIDPPATVVDLVYGVARTPVARWGAAGGARVVEGLEVLVRQGARSLALWTGRNPSVDTMRVAAASRGKAAA